MDGRHAQGSSSRRSARRYERYATLLSYGQDPRWRRFLVSRIEAGPGDRVLDVATGTGAVARELVRQKGCRSSASTRAPRCSRRPARRANGDVELVEASAEQLPFADGEFDALTFTYLLRYVDDPAATLARARAGRPARAARSPASSSALPARRRGGRSGSCTSAVVPPGRGRAARQRLARGRRVPRPLDPRLLRRAGRSTRQLEAWRDAGHRRRRSAARSRSAAGS